MLGFNIKDYIVTKIRVEKANYTLGGENVIKIIASIEVKYKDKNDYTLTYTFDTGHCDIFGFTWALSKDHANKASWLIQEIEKKSWFAKRLIENRFEILLKEKTYQNVEKQLLEKYK